MPDACDCWTNNNALGHDAHCCFVTDDGRTWRDDADCADHRPTPTDTGGRK